MNKQFNINRFGRLFVKHTAEHYKSYLMSLTVLIGVMVLGGSFIVYIIPGSLDAGFQSALFLAILFLAGTIFASTIFADYGDRKRSVAALTLPASHLEKYLVAWLYSFVIFLLVFTSSFYLILVFLLSLKPVTGQTPDVFNVFGSQVGFFMFLLFAFLHSVAFFGAIFFEKLHFIKTAFVFFLCIGLLYLLNYLILRAFTGSGVLASAPFGNLRLTENSKVLIIMIPRERAASVPFGMLALVLLFWTAAYFRLKEKQV